MKNIYKDHAKINELGIEYQKTKSQRALKELIEALTTYIPRFLFKKFPHSKKWERDDVVNDTILNMWSAIDQYDKNKASFKTWCTSIAFNLYLLHIRSNSYSKRVSTFSALNMNGLTDDDVKGRKYLNDVLLVDTEEYNPEYDTIDIDALIDTLKPGWKELIRDKYINKLSYKEMQPTYGLPINTMKTRCRVGIERMKIEYAQNKYKYTRFDI